MSQTKRLGQLHAAESWQDTYRYLINADFKSYDFETLRAALLNYIQTNYPENFNDFINSSEYVALIDLISFFGQNIAFRSDLNLRETFLETAEVRSNVLSIARQLGYKPFRNGVADGFLRLTAINTTQQLYDSKGTNLAGRQIIWADSQNKNFNEQWTTILNEVLNKANPYGRPISSIVDNGTVRQLYQLDQPENRTMVESFNLTAKNATTYNCEIIPVAIDLASQLASESEPNPYGNLTMLFNNDGTGYSNKTNGWFFMFKQGVLKFEDYTIDTRIENRIIDLRGSGINETDVWVQSIDGTGIALQTWVAVPNTVGQNIAFSAINKDIRAVYEIITRSNDEVSIKFGNGSFADIPMGNIRIWYRESAQESIVFNAVDVAGLQMSMQYLDSSGTEQSLLLTFELADSIINSASESMAQIKSRAARTSASQERMITSSDYNVYPEGKVSGISKIKSINRTYAGQSAFADPNDPTGTYRPVISIAADGFLYSNESSKQDNINDNRPTNEVIAWIQDSLLNRNLHQLYYTKFTPITATAGKEISLKRVDYSAGTTHGYFHLTDDSNMNPLRVGRGSTDTPLRTIRKDTLVFNGTTWAKILDIYREGFGASDNSGMNTGLRANGQGAIFINGTIDNITITKWMPSLRTIFNDSEKFAISNEINAERNFGLRYNHLKDIWEVIKVEYLSNVETILDLTTAGSTGINGDASWLTKLVHTPNSWTSVVRTDITVFGSASELTFHNQRFGAGVDQLTNRTIKDSVKFLAYNSSDDESLDVYDYFKLGDGRYDPTRVQVLLPGLNESLVPTDPDIITRVIAASQLPQPMYLNKKFFSDSIGQYTLTPTTQELGEYEVQGRHSIKVQFNHVPLRNNRVDAATTNLIDMFVLTDNYDSDFRSWISTGAQADNKPLTLTSYEIGQLMAPIVPYKSVSDTIIFQPVKYKVIFGSGSEMRNRIRLRVTKSDGTRISNAEISSRVIASVNSYFAVQNWDFGETFYFTDMANWVHTELSGVISSIALIPVQVGLTSNDMFYIPCDDDELLISSITVADVDIITTAVSPTNTVTNNPVTGLSS